MVGDLARAFVGGAGVEAFDRTRDARVELWRRGRAIRRRSV